MAAADVYANEMTTLMHGYPLWEPECSPEVSIADVGYIRRGRFCRLFNASLPPGHPLNDFGVPEGYEQLILDERAMIERRVPRGPMYSRSITTRGAELDFSGPGSILQTGAGFQFSCANDRGAVLVINSEARRKDSEQLGALKKYMLKHYKSWYSFANGEPHSRDISLSDLVFVTGRDNTADWAVAAFSERSISGGIQFTAGVPNIASGTFSVWGSWSGLRSIHTNCGPPIPYETTSAIVPRSGEYRHVCAADLEAYNQCIFLRGFRVMDRTKQVRQKLGLKVSSNSGGLELLQQPWMSRSASSDWNSAARDRSNTSGASGGKRAQAVDGSALENSDNSMKLEIVSNEVEYCAPAELLLTYILQNPEASVAIVHDNDLNAIIKNSESFDLDILLNKLSPSVAVDSEGVGTLSLDVPEVLPTKRVDTLSTEDPRPNLDWKDKLRLNDIEPRNKLPSQPPRRGSQRSHGKDGKPDIAAYDEQQAHITAEIDGLQARLNETRNKLSLISRHGSGADRQAILRTQLDSLRNQQLTGKTSRDAITADIKKTQEEIRIKIKSINSIAKKAPAKTIDELESKTRSLQRKLEAGNMSESEEKKITGQINSLQRSQTVILSCQALQAEVETHREKVEKLRQQLASQPQDLSERIAAARAELDALQKAHDEVFANRQDLYRERGELQKEVSTLLAKRQQAAQQFREKNNAYRERINEDRVQEAERQRAEKSAQEEQKRAEARERLLEKARAPAFAAELRDCRTLLEYFSGKADHTSTPSSPTMVTGPQRSDTGRSSCGENHPGPGWVPLKKKGDDDEFFVGGKGKSKKGQRRGASSSVAAPSKISIPLGIMSTLMSLAIAPPSSTSEVPRTIEEIKKKIEWFEANQTKVTEENIARTEADLHRIGHFTHMQSMNVLIST